MRPPGPLALSKTVTATPFSANDDAHTSPDTVDRKIRVKIYMHGSS